MIGFGFFGFLLTLGFGFLLNLVCVAEGTSSLLSLVKTFDSVLSAYEGFCNLKQVPISHSDSLYLLILIVSFGG